MKNLVIVESPTKASTISKFLGKDYDIKSSMGHVMDLPKSKMGVDMTNNFLPEFEIMENKNKILAEIKKAAKTAEYILLATDPDREGEAIASNIKDILEGEKGSKGDKRAKGKITFGTSVSLGSSVSSVSTKFRRIVFHEIQSS